MIVRHAEYEVAFPPLGDALADFIDLAGQIGAECERQALRQRAAAGAHPGVPGAHPGGLHTDSNLTTAR